MSEAPSTRLRLRLAQPAIIVAPGAHDALTARIIERAGFEAVYFTGAGFSYTHLGTPDLGLVSATETIARVAAITEATSLPVIADGDTGYGNWLNVQRTVRDFERAGAAAIQLEDQVLPKRCGHLAGKAVIPTDEAAGKIKAAVDARRGDLVIIARTDARAVAGLEDALERAARYHEAGADVLFVEAPATHAELAAIPGRLGAPALANMVEGGATPPSTAAALEAMGYRIVIFPGAAVRVAARAIARLMADLKVRGTTEGMRAEMLAFGELNELLGLEALQRAEARYLPPP
jgi:2-methylisocitrate lyase-like PEP mutase family enzyme